jgi:hypothetical protein
MIGLKNLFKKLIGIDSIIRSINNNAEIIKILNAKHLICSTDYECTSKSIRNFEFKVTSQFGEDGIIQYLINKLDPHIINKYFIEFGVESYVESNTRFLLQNNGWSGLVIDGSMSNIKSLKKSDVYWLNDINAICAFITAENIDEILRLNSKYMDIGILSIDIDGNDYWVFNNINSIKPTIIITEYNALFGKEHSITIPYKSEFVRTEAHYTNLYWGASLSALTDLANAKGYALIGCNSAGNNAFFVKKASISDLQELSAKEAYIPAKFNESRDSNYNLNFLNNFEKIKLLGDLPVYNTKSKQVVMIKELNWD